MLTDYQRTEILKRLPFLTRLIFRTRHNYEKEVFKKHHIADGDTVIKIRNSGNYILVGLKTGARLRIEHVFLNHDSIIIAEKLLK